jgi:hypothetical protein
MRKPISPRVHGILDYATVATVAAAPRMLDFPEEAERLCYALAGGYLGLSLFTDYPLSARRTIPFKGHGITEAVIGAALPTLPWALGFSQHRAARNFCFGLSALTAVVAALTDWSTPDRGRRRRRKARNRTTRQRKPRLVA